MTDTVDDEIRLSHVGKQLPSTAWVGSGNPDGRPSSGGVGKPISTLRRSLTQMRRLEPKAIELLEASMLDEDEFKECVALGIRSSATKTPFTITKQPNKTQLDSAKFVVKQIEALTKGATQDEISMMNLRKAVFEDGDITTLSDGGGSDSYQAPKPMFSLTMSKEQEISYERTLAAALGE